MEAVKAAYEKANPNTNVVLTISPVKEYDDKLTTALSGNSDIHVMCINGSAHYAQLASKNQLLAQEGAEVL